MLSSTPTPSQLEAPLPWKLPSREERAWAAGFFEGEGCVMFRTYGEKKAGKMNIKISQVDPEVLERFKAFAGMGSVYGPHSHTNNGREVRPQWSYQLQVDDKVLTVMAMMWDYMGHVKKAQAQRVFAKWRSSPRTHRRAGERCRNGHKEWKVTPKGRVCQGCIRESYLRVKPYLSGTCDDCGARCSVEATRCHGCHWIDYRAKRDLSHRVTLG